MTELHPDDHARLRRTFQHMDDLAPPAPSLDSLSRVDKVRGRRSKRLTSALAGAAIVLVTVGIVVVARGPRSSHISDYEASITQSNSQDDAIVFLDPDISSDQLAAIGQALQTLEGVQSFYYVDRDQALAEFKEAAADTPSAIEDIDPNMLPTQYRLALADDADVATIVTDLEHLPGVRKVVLSPSVLARSDTTPAPEMTPDVAADLTAMAVARSCTGECSSRKVHLYENLRTVDTPIGQEQPIPDSTRRAIANQFADVQFVDAGQQDALFDQDGLIDGGNGVLISVGPIEDLAAGVVGIEIAIQFTRFDVQGQIVQFQWTSQGWLAASSDETGVTVTTSAS
jgi:hypothetical protein